MSAALNYLTDWLEETGTEKKQLSLMLGRCRSYVCTFMRNGGESPKAILSMDSVVNWPAPIIDAALDRQDEQRRVGAILRPRGPRWPHYARMARRNPPVTNYATPHPQPMVHG